MKKNDAPDALEKETSESNQRLDDLLRQELATPPLSNEEIMKRSKESHRGAGDTGEILGIQY